MHNSRRIVSKASHELQGVYFSDNVYGAKKALLVHFFDLGLKNQLHESDKYEPKIGKENKKAQPISGATLER